MSTPGSEIEQRPPVDRSAERPQFGLRLVLEAVTLGAIVAAASRAFGATSLVVLAIYGLTWLFGCWRTKRASLFAMAGMYGPFMWVFFYTEAEIWGVSLLYQFPLLPGIVGAMFLGQLVRSFEIASFLSTMAIFFLIVSNARTPRDAAGAGLMLAFAFSVLSFLTYLVVAES